jgi:5,10-methylenetetrahydromethanopterin reductase
MELWTVGGAGRAGIAAVARRLEDEGWDGMGLVDSQNLAPDPFVLLGLAAGATSRLLLATAVTNPVTRHPATLAAAAATVQGLSGGRVVLGIGRGDSSLAHLGHAPASPRAFERYLIDLQAYLRGEDVAFVADEGRSVDALGLASGPTSSQLHWLDSASAKVPVDVAASGPRVIGIAARRAERITFAVGASAERLRWAIEVAHRARADSGLASDGPALGAYVPIMVHPDRATARALVSGGTASYARFSVMHGTVTGPADESERAVLAAVHDSYDMGHHFTHGSPQSAPLTDEVIDTFAIAGPPSYCVERVGELMELGVTKIFFMGGGLGLDRDAARQARRALVEDVLPALR